MSKKRITIIHQLEKTKHTFLVIDPNNLTQNESERIIRKMGVEMILVNGRLYRGL